MTLGIQTTSGSAASLARSRTALPARLTALWWLWVLFLPVSLLGFAAVQLARGTFDPLDTQHVPAFNRMSSSLVLVWAGFAWWQHGRAGAWSRYALLVALGMAWGCLGDFFNANLVPIGLENPVMGGIVSFAIGHLCYMAATFDAAARLRLWNRTAWLVSTLSWESFALVGWYFAVQRGSLNVELRIPALGYTLLLAGTASCATALAWQQSRFTVLAAGAGLFLLSDLVLAVPLFHGSFPASGDVVWLLYGSGQMSIVYALAWLVDLAPRPHTR